MQTKPLPGSQPCFLCSYPHVIKILLSAGSNINANNKAIFRGCLSKTGTKTTNIWSEVNQRKNKPQDSYWRLIVHFWDAGQCGFHLMMDRSDSPVSLALAVGAMKGKLTEREIQHGRFQSDEQNISLRAAGCLYTTAQTKTFCCIKEVMRSKP